MGLGWEGSRQERRGGGREEFDFDLELGGRSVGAGVGGGARTAGTIRHWHGTAGRSIAVRAGGMDSPEKDWALLK